MSTEENESSIENLPAETENTYNNILQQCRVKCGELAQEVNRVSRNDTFDPDQCTTTCRENTLVDIGIEINLDSLEKAVVHASGFLRKHLVTRFSFSKSLRPIARGPSMSDGSVFYRIGEGLVPFYKYTEQDFEDKKKRRLAAGFPDLQWSELSLVNMIQLSAMREAFPEVMIIPKHFPGGDNELYYTHYRQVHYSAAEHDFAMWIANYEQAFSLMNQHGGVMLAHASYDLKDFPNVTPDFLKRVHSTLHPWLQQFDLHEIPASLHPGFVMYLREIMEFGGLIIPDWYYPMGAITDFVAQITPNEIFFDGLIDTETIQSDIEQKWSRFTPESKRLEKIQAHIAEITLLARIGIIVIPLALDAGMSFGCGLGEDLIKYCNWERMAQKYPKVYKRMEQKLNVTLEDTFTIIADPDSELIFDTNKFSIREKMYLYLAKIQWREEYSKAKIRYVQQFFDLENSSYSDEYKREVAWIFMANNPNFSGFDIWNRTGFLTFAFRVETIKTAFGIKDIPDPPTWKEGKEKGQAAEIAWFEAVMSNEQFRKIYDQIDWGSLLLSNIFKKQQQKIES